MNFCDSVIRRDRQGASNAVRQLGKVGTGASAVKSRARKNARISLDRRKFDYLFSSRNRRSPFFRACTTYKIRLSSGVPIRTVEPSANR